MLQGHVGKIRILHVAIVRQKLSEMELNEYSIRHIG